MKRFACTTLAALCLSLGMAVAAQDATASDKAAPAMSPEMQAMMAAYEKAAAPGSNHAFLAKMEGHWDATAKMWMGPGEPEVSTGVSENRMILGGRFLLQDFEGMVMGRPFKGMGLTGFDNVSGKFASVWVDSMGTGMMTGSGSLDASGKVLRSVDRYNDPTVKGPKETRDVLTLVDDDTIVMEMFEKGPDGKEVKTMEITYRRVKGK